MIGFILFALIIVGGVAWASYLDHKRDTKCEAEVQKQLDEYIEAQKQIPESRLEILLVDSTIIYSDYFKADASIHWFFHTPILRTASSKDQAEYRAESIVKYEYYKYGDIFYPVSSIKEMKVVQ
jgi:hypothetical protein